MPELPFGMKMVRGLLGSVQGGRSTDYTGVVLPDRILSGAVVEPGWDNNGWSAHDLTWWDVQRLLSSQAIDSPKVQTWEYTDNYAISPHFSTTKPGNVPYDEIKLIKVDDPKSVAANNVIDNFKNRGFWFAADWIPFQTYIQVELHPKIFMRRVKR